jgi:Uncharacterized flagellar protein FlaG
VAVSMTVDATFGMSQEAQQASVIQNDNGTGRAAVTSSATNAPGTVDQSASEVTRTQTSKLVDQANQILSPTPTNLHYVYYDELNRYYVQIENSRTHEVVAEIPPKKLLDFAASIAEKLGLIINKRI